MNKNKMNKKKLTNLGQVTTESGQSSDNKDSLINLRKLSTSYGKYRANTSWLMQDKWGQVTTKAN